MDIGLIIAVIGLGLFCHRLQLFSGFRIRKSPQDFRKKVSIIIPCRDEEKNIHDLLKYFQELSYPFVEILVVDDHSSDKTAELAKMFKVQVIKTPERPKNWTGKNWPCWIGANAATGDYLLFTDADTRHTPHSLEKALEFFNSKKADLISAPPFHSCKNIWEKALGFFHLLPLFITNYLAPPKEERLFAIGQYMFFKKESYFAMGGHQEISSSLVDDIDLAQLCLKKKMNYQVYPMNDLYEVQMYATFKEFVAGWTRLIRLGLPRSQFTTFIEVCCLLNFILYVFTGANILLSLVGLGLLAWAQRHQGDFKIWGVLFTPLNALLFIYITLAANIGVLMKNKITWRGRSYLGALILGLSFLSFKSEAANIKLHITDFRSGKGAIAVSLFREDQKKSFPGKADKAFKTLYVPLEGEVVMNLELGNIPPGRYAIALLHDENQDGKYNSNIVGVPLEGFGFSNNPKVYVGAPGFDKCSFEMKDEDKNVAIRLKYFL